MARTTHAVRVFRAVHIDKILEDLEKCESASGLFARATKKKHVFVNGGNQALVCSRLKRVSQWRSMARELLVRRSFRSCFLGIGDTTSNVNRIRVKNNVLGFYPDRNLVCKFRRRSSVRPLDSLEREAEAIKSAGSFSFFKLPQIVLDHSKAKCGKVSAIWIKQVKGKPAGKSGVNRKAIALRVLEGLLLWYEEHGVEVALPKSLAPECWKAPTDNYERMLAYGWNKHEAGVIVKAVDKISMCSLKMPVSCIHGDASVGNCMVDENGELVVLDWEMSARDYIAKDVSKLARQGGSRCRLLYENWLKRLYGNRRDMLDQDIQLSMVFLCSNMDLVSRVRYFSKMMTPGQGLERIVVIKEKVLSSALSIGDRRG